MRTWPGKNVAVSWEFEPFEGLTHLWPEGEQAVRRFLSTPRWSEQVRIKYEMRERLSASKYAAATTGLPIQCNSLAAHPMLLADHPTAMKPEDDYH